MSSPSVEDPVRKRIENLQVFIRLVREALAHALGAHKVDPGRDLHAVLYHLAQAGRGAEIDLAEIQNTVWCSACGEPLVIDRGESVFCVVTCPACGEACEFTETPPSPKAAPASPHSALCTPHSEDRAACDVTAEIPPGGQITCGPLRIKRRDFGSDVTIELKGEVRIDAILAGTHIRIRTDGRWYPEVQASPADLPLVLVGQGATQRAIREEDV